MQGKDYILLQGIYTDELHNNGKGILAELVSDSLNWSDGSSFLLTYGMINCQQNLFSLI